MNSYPANEQRISDVERGRSCAAILPLPDGTSLAVGDSILFEQVNRRSGQESPYSKGGDSVRVLLTDVTDLGTKDQATGQSLFQVSWRPLGQVESTDAGPKRVARPRGPRGS